MNIEKYLEEQSLYILGPAGSGKTYLVREKKGDSFIYLGPTNLISRSIGGETYHKFLGIYKDNINYLDEFQIKTTCINILKKLENKQGIYLDEISMVPSNIDCFIDKCIKNINKKYNRNLQYIRGGDPLQIPCINGNLFTESSIFKNSEKLILTEVKRQKNKEFIECLNQFRKGNPKYLIENFQRLGGRVSTDYLNFLKCTTITTSNKKRISVNYVAYILLSNLQKDKREFEGEYKRISEKGNEITFCKDYKVIFCTNSYDFSNGEAGKILNIELLKDDSILIKIIKEDSSILTLNIEKEEKVPFEGGYCITSHSIQGQTIKSGTIQILLDKNDFLWRTPGSLYNALSRTISPEQIYIHTRDIKEIEYLCKVNLDNLQYS